MKQRFLVFLTASFLSVFSSNLYAQGQVDTFYLIETFSVGRIDTIISNFGAPPGLLVPEYAVDVYKVIYRTPYRHPDSLVQASGAIAIARDYPCPLPLAGYFHGTVAERTNVPSYLSTESNIGIVFASTGYVVAMPDYLGLGDKDPKVLIHPYMHAFSQSNTSLNMLRATRSVFESLELELNGQLFLTGYSQGGFTTMATHRLIEGSFPNEFTITGSSPMSGAYDLKDAQVEMIASDSVYATPGYLPYVILGYGDQHPNLFTNPSEVFKSPYDTLMPYLFYSGTYEIGYINSQSTPVPKHMILDTTYQNFVADSTHRLRIALAESHLLDWAPQAPVNILYCEADEQVSYVNSVNAFNSWTANGSPDVQLTNFGNFDHGGCIPFALFDTKFFFDNLRNPCNPDNAFDLEKPTSTRLWPNPADQNLFVKSNLLEDHAIIKIFGVDGKEWPLNHTPADAGRVKIPVEHLPSGFYLLTITRADGKTERMKFLK